MHSGRAFLPSLPVIGILGLAGGWLFFSVVSHAWVSDDAYITFRVVDNILAGYGAVWNPDERVQVYTHPLWMLLHLPAQALLGNIYLTTLILSFLCFAGAVWLSVRGCNPWRAALLFLLPLSLSRPLMHFATGGLETPLSLFLLAWFARMLVRGEWRWIPLCSALLLLTRLDFAVFLAPAWLWLLWKHSGRLSLRTVFVGALPLLLWSGFSLFYYGFLFPNTKYAKLHTGIPGSDLVIQGLYYLLDLAIADLLSAGLLAALFLPAWNERGAKQMLAGGAIAYGIYIIAVGGDFMSGRFWAVPIFTSLWLLLHDEKALYAPRHLALAALVFCVMALGASALRERVWSTYCPAQAVYPPSDDEAICTLHGISDERAYYAGTTGFLPGLRLQPDAQTIELPAIYSGVAAGNAMGLAGYYAPPGTLLIDMCGLTEPLLARLPTAPGPWRIGHFSRALPEGFLQARVHGDFSKMDKGLAGYYQKLRLVTSGPLLSRERFAAILDFQLGRDDYGDAYDQ